MFCVRSKDRIDLSSPCAHSSAPQADLGIAIGAGAEIAMEAADMVLVRSQLSDVVIALHLSSAIFHRIPAKA